MKQRLNVQVLLGLLVAVFVAIGISFVPLSAAPPAITLVNFVTNFTNPIGIDFHQDILNSENGIGDLIISTNYPTGVPHNLDLIQVPSGNHIPYSILNGLTEELKIATVRTTPGCQQFPIGDVFTGTGKAGEIVRIDQDGNFAYPAHAGAGPLAGGGNSWVQLPGEPNLLRGSLYVDRTCVFGGDLIVVTGSDPGRGGDVWRVNVSGVTTFVANTLGQNSPSIFGPHLEGVITVPCSVNVLNQPCPANDPVWGPWAGTILIGNERQTDDLSQDGFVFSVTPGGVVTPFNLSFTDSQGIHHPMKTEDLDIIEAGNGFFGVNYGNQRVLRAAKQDFTTFVDKILLTQEYPCGSAIAATPCAGAPSGSHATTGLYVLSFVGTGGNAGGGVIQVTPLTASATSISNIDQWEHVTFAPLGNPRLRVVKTPDNGTFPFQGQATFSIVVTNFGFDDATNVVLNDALPGAGGLVWVTATSTVGTCVSPIVGNALSCNIGTLIPGQSATITVSTAATTPAAACTVQNNLAAIATADGGLSAQDDGKVTCTPPPPPNLGHGDTATIGFWHNKNGQAVLNCLNGGSNSTALGNYLASTYPSLFGAGPGSLGNLAGKTNAQIAAIYLTGTYFDASGQKVNAQMIGVAFATYVTSSNLSGGTNCGAKFGFNFSAGGTGTKTFNVGSNGHLLGPGFVDNGTYTIFQLLQGANAAKAAGTFNANAWNEVFSAINESGDIN